MNPTAAFALGMLIGIGIGGLWAYLWLSWQVNQYAMDLDEAEKHIRRLEHQTEGLAYKAFWLTEAQKLRAQHNGTPYAGPGVRGSEYSAAWIDES